MKKELSIFIDESGDFGVYNPKSPYYIIGMVVHEQSNNLSSDISHFDAQLKTMNVVGDFVHLGPLIRGEKDYRLLQAEERAKIIWKMLGFMKKIPFACAAFMVEKKHTESDTEIIQKLARQLSDFIRAHYPYFLGFDKIKVYYDNGQAGVMKIIISVFTALFGEVEFKKAAQRDYKLLQIADLVCTAKLTELKMRSKTLSKSERRVLGSDNNIMKNIIKPIRRKEFEK